MNLDEFAFTNQQLAGMLHSGIPLEGALKQLAENMQKGTLRTELQSLEKDLAKGTPVKDALEKRNLPPFYVKMVQLGIKANNLPLILTALADHYRQTHSILTRLKGLMIYPIMVLILAFSVSIFLEIGLGKFIHSTLNEVLSGATPITLVTYSWVVPLWIGGVLLLTLIVLASPSLRIKLRWRIPAFKEANLSRLANTLAILLQGGSTLNEALGVVRELEADSPMERELATWQKRLASGESKLNRIVMANSIVPPLFAWILHNAGSDFQGGLHQAAEIYGERSRHRIEMFLYAALPMAVLVLGLLICIQMSGPLLVFVKIITTLGQNND